MHIEGSATQLTKMVMNLILNAAEAQPAGGEIAISTRNQYVDIPIQGYEIIKEAQRLGAGKYIRKPYTYEEIGMAIKEALEK